MKSLLIAFLIAGFGSLAVAASNTATFSDSTKVEVVNLPQANGVPTNSNVIQIKQYDGATLTMVCYGISGNSSNQSTSLSCVKQ